LAGRAEELSTWTHRLRPEGPGFSTLNDWKCLRLSATTNSPTLEREMSPALKTNCDDGLKEIFFFATWFKKK
jgi:hypothetical protein